MTEIIQIFQNALALDSSHVFWFATRSAGLMAYLLLWLSTVWGLAVASKAFDRFLPRLFTFDAHEFLSLLGLGFLGVHMVSLLFDSYAPFTVSQLLIPFTSTYRPFWVGIGILATYFSVLVTVTFYLRQRIGFKNFRTLHYFSFAAFFMGALHGLFAGTDAGLLTSELMYAETVLVVLLLTGYWLWTLGARRRSKTVLQPMTAGAAIASESRKGANQTGKQG